MNWLASIKVVVQFQLSLPPFLSCEIAAESPQFFPHPACVIQLARIRLLECVFTRAAVDACRKNVFDVHQNHVYVERRVA
jgi:hypothetical protein